MRIRTTTKLERRAADMIEAALNCYWIDADNVSMDINVPRGPEHYLEICARVLASIAVARSIKEIRAAIAESTVPVSLPEFTPAGPEPGDHKRLDICVGEIWATLYLCPALDISKSKWPKKWRTDYESFE